MVENQIDYVNEMDEDSSTLQLAENEDVEEVEEGLDNLNDSEQKRKLLEKTKINKQTWSILEINRKIQRKELVLDPDFQRSRVWGIDKKTAFIESLYMEIMIPPIYVVEIPGDDVLAEQKYEVVDGKQRLSAILDFINGNLILSKKYLEYYSDIFGGKNFSEIKDKYSEQTMIMLSSVLDIYVITANSPEYTKYDIFARLNKGAEALKVNEIRRAIYHSDVTKTIMDFINERTSEKADKDLKDSYARYFSKNAIKRFDDYGRFYRSIAYYLNYDKDEKKVLGYNSRPRDMINTVLQDLQEKRKILDREKTIQLLNKTLELMEVFAKDPNIDYLVDGCIPFALDSWEIVINKTEKIKNDEKVQETLKKSPATTSNVNARISRIMEILGEAE